MTSNNFINFFATYEQVEKPKNADYTEKKSKIKYRPPEEILENELFEKQQEYSQEYYPHIPIQLQKFDNKPELNNELIEQQPNEEIKSKDTKIDSSLLKLDIEDLLKQEGITSINGKRIKCGSKEIRPANASYGAQNSNHKKRDPHTGNAMARDISIEGGDAKDYEKFKMTLLLNPRICAWMSMKKWGIINEITPDILKRTRGTGPHFHFGPDTWAVRTWNTWISNPNISVTKAI